MGQKVSPVGFRLGIIRDWEAKWYADKNYTELLHEDLQIRKVVAKHLDNAGVSRVEIERAANRIRISVHTAKPGIVIGKGGAGVDELRRKLEKFTGKQVHINIIEIKVPEMDAYLVAESIATQLTKRIAFRRAMKQSVFRTMRSGAKGIKVMVSGRLGGAEIARREAYHEGSVPLQTLRANIDYGFVEAHTTYGRIGVKVWIYKGEVLPTKQKNSGGGDQNVSSKES
ncbi:MAG: 30S ribosomal protein S3 [Firmicutes bacterium]|nr:30S ribosomal protein S3 [Dethiobacter sp.]MBS3900090.1 30S ribosomal protein S3 [Dethiobacter sp.]MCL4462769.1 30S ribosomal protein S3 [Bacillota bacterium]MCL5993514.1 30S ribosomal protein S3 [Bacillota bacterium]